MISRLRGEVVTRSPNGVVLDVGGVGYLVNPTAGARRKAEPGGEVVLETYLHVREDVLQLFGFADAAERELFALLLSVQGVGPKVAPAIVSGSSPDELRRAIALEDTARFQAIPGIGKKTAERVVLELKERLGSVGDVHEPTSLSPKTSLAFIVREELGVGLRTVAGPALERKGDVAAILTGLSERDVLFVDEIHRLNRAVEEILYPALEDFRLDIIVGQGPAARTLTLDLPPFTLVGATTRTGLLTSPLRDRFGLTFRLEHYEPPELARIVRRSARILEVEIEDEAADEIAGRSRGTPRIANRILRRVRDVAEVRHQGAITTPIAREALDLMEVDARGLERIDRALLRAVVEKFDGGPVGLSTLAVALGEETDTIEDVYEPYLLQLGFLQRTPRGRIVTKLGREHVGAAAADDGPNSLF